MSEFWKWMKEKIWEGREKEPRTVTEEINDVFDEIDKRRSSINGDGDPFGF